MRSPSKTTLFALLLLFGFQASPSEAFLGLSRVAKPLSEIPNAFDSTVLLPKQDIIIQHTETIVKSPSFWLGGASYCVALDSACQSGFGSLPWFASIAGVALASLGMAKSFQFLQDDFLLEPKEQFPWIFGAHIFSWSAMPLMKSLLGDSIQDDTLFLLSILFMTVGTITEVAGHFHDGWVFRSGGHSAHGVENIILSACIVGSIAMAAASMVPSLETTLLAFAPVAGVLAIPWLGSWQDNKGLVYAIQGSVSGVATWVFCHELESLWPLMFLVQALNIVRVSKRLMERDVQVLHLLPSVYGWFSYVMPFGLAAVSPKSSLFMVMTCCLGSVWLADAIETEISRVHML